MYKLYILMYIRFLPLRATSDVEMNRQKRESAPKFAVEPATNGRVWRSAYSRVWICTCSHEGKLYRAACTICTLCAYKRCDRLRGCAIMQGFVSRTNAVSHWSFVLFSRQLPSVNTKIGIRCVEVAPRWEQTVNKGWGFANTEKRRERGIDEVISGGTSEMPKRTQILGKRARGKTITPFLSSDEGKYQLNIWEIKNFNVIYQEISVRITTQSTTRRIAIGEETRTRMTVRDTESRVAVSLVLPLPRTAYSSSLSTFAPPRGKNAYSNLFVRLDRSKGLPSLRRRLVKLHYTLRHFLTIVSYSISYFYSKVSASLYLSCHFLD